jgi:hypothetical protein
MNNGNSRARTADIVILEAGVMGASMAFHLAKRNAGKIVVVDKGHVGQGEVVDLPRLSACTTVILPRSGSPW